MNYINVSSQKWQKWQKWYDSAPFRCGWAHISIRRRSKRKKNIYNTQPREKLLAYTIFVCEGPSYCFRFLFSSFFLDLGTDDSWWMFKFFITEKESNQHKYFSVCGGCLCAVLCGGTVQTEDNISHFLCCDLDGCDGYFGAR